MTLMQFDPRELRGTEGASAAWRNALSASDSLDRRHMAFHFADLICHLIDSDADDEALKQIAERIARLASEIGNLTQKPASKDGKKASSIELSDIAPESSASKSAQTTECFDAEALNLLADLLMRVLQARRRLAPLEPNLAEVVLDDQIDAVLVIDPSGVLQFANASALRLIALSTILSLKAGHISSPEPLIASSLRKLVRSASKGLSGGDLSFPPKAAGYKGSVASLPGANVPLVCIRVRDEKTWAAAQANRARLLHSFTETETRLAEALLLGLTPIDIAEQRKVSMSTIRTQLRSLYIKTDVTGQAELKKGLERL